MPRISSSASRILLVACLLAMGPGGPGAHAEPWRSTGPEGGWITVLHHPYATGPAVLAGTYGGGVFYSQDDGRSWTDITGTMHDYVVVDFVSSHGPLPRTWVATAEGIVYRTGSFSGLWDFASAGLGSGNPPPQLAAIAVDQTDPRKLAACGLEGLWLTENGGATWPDSLLIRLGGAHNDVEISDRAPVTYYVTSPVEIWRSQNARDFVSLSQGLPPGYMMDLEIWPGSVDSLLVAYLDLGLYLSEDGASFRYIGPNSSAANSPLLRKVEVLPETGEIFLCSERTLHYTADLGASWHSLDEREPLQYPEYWSLLPLDAAQHEFLVGSFGRGVLRTTPDGRWVPQNSGLIATWVTDLAVQGDLVLAATRNGRLYLSRDGGENWKDVTGNLDSLGILSVSISADGSRWLVGALEGPWYSDDEGVVWKRPSRGYPAVQAVFELQSMPSAGPGVVYAGTLAGVYLSRDFGESWKREPSLPPDRAFRVAAVDPQGRIWWGGDRAGLYRAEFGQPFGAVDLGTVGLPPSIRALAFHPTRPDLFYWADTQDLFRWTPEEGSVSLGSALPEPAVRDLLVLPGGTVVVALAEEGIFASESDGADWMDWNEGLVPTRPLTLAYREGPEPALLTGTFARGVFLKDLIAPTPRVVGEPEPIQRVRSQPNPFNPRTLVSFHLERPGLARVEVFDQRGRKVALLHAGPLPAGENEFRWDAKDAAGHALAVTLLR
jgi:hypothetical protein